MKIAYLTGNRWPGREPGLSFSLHNARGFLATGADFTLILFAEENGAPEAIASQFFQGGPTPRILALRAPLLGGSRFLYYLRALHHLATTPYDVLVFRALTFLPFAARLKRWTGMPVWFEAHDFWTDPALRDGPVRGTRRRHVRLERRFVRDVDGILCVSEPQAELYRRYYPDLPVVTAETGCKPPRAPRTEPFTHTLGYVGSLTPEKYPLELVMAALAEGSDRRVRFVCVGARDASQRERLERVAADFGVAERVEVHDWAHGAELARLEARMDVGVAPLSDSFLNRIASPLKVLEYLAAGLPFVATRLGGIERLVTDGREGLLVANTPSAWRAALERMYADHRGWADMSAHCVDTARRSSWEARAQKIETALRSRVAIRALPAST